jgi:3'-phosphoadenosine 5'-phosphosulfate synthase
MCLLACNGAVPSSPTNIPMDLVEANCIPSGFIIPTGWEGVVDYYKHMDEVDHWIPWLQPFVELLTNTKMHQLGGCFGTPSFKLEHTDYDSF